MIAITWATMKFFAPPPLQNQHEALDTLKKAITQHPKDARLYIQCSELHLKSRKQAQALKLAKQATQLEPQNPMAWLCLARALLAEQNYQTANKALTKALSKIPPTHPLRKELKQMQQRYLPTWWQPLVGKKLKLVRIQEHHLSFLSACRNNIEFQHHYNLFKSNNIEIIKKEIQQAKQSPLEINKIEWVIEHNETPVGIGGLVSYDGKNRRAEIQIGFPEEKNYGFAIEATLLILDFGFNALQLNKIFSYVYSDNPHSQKSTLHLGFTQEGLLRQHVFDAAANDWLDLHVNGLLKHEYNTLPVLQKFKQRFMSS